MELKNIDWKEFLKDLEETPAFVSQEFGMSVFCPLQYVLLVRDIPLKVVETLLRLNPRAVDDREVDHGWGILNWVALFYHPVSEFSPDILRLLVKEAPASLPLECMVEFGGTPMAFP
jgi:hypothetical protein